MEVLFVTHKYPPVTGGMEKQSYELIKGMERHVKVHKIAYEGTGSRIRFFWSLKKRIRKICAEHPGIRVIHFNDGLIAAFSLLFKVDEDLKQVVTLHGLDVVYPNWIYQRLVLKRFNRFDLVVAVSRATADACKLRGISAQKIVVINNGVDTHNRADANRAEAESLLQQKYNVDGKAKRLLIAIGRPVKRKGFSWFIKNVSPLLPDDYLLLLIGPVSLKKDRWLMDLLPSIITKPVELLLGLPSDENEIYHLLADPLMHKRAIRLGKLTEKEMNILLSAADAFIMPNIEVDGDMEGFGLVCLEAAMCGATVIAAASGGITDAVIDKKNGVLVHPGDHAAWARTIISQTVNPHCGREEIISFTQNHYSWNKMVSDYAGAFIKVSPPDISQEQL
jgi:glycosyltransferase involved in cell wall biosynthesis